jgi:hypothetical protein
MTPERDGLERQVAAITAEADAVLAGLTEAQVNWRPSPERWSIGDCISHLNVGIRVVLPALDRAIETARDRGWTGQGPFRYGWFANWMARSQEPPVRRRIRTWPIIQPVTERHDAARLQAEFHAVRSELRERLTRAAGLDWRRAKVQSPVSRFVRMPFGAYLAFLLAHDRRHLWQARGVRNHPAFPA